MIRLTPVMSIILAAIGRLRKAFIAGAYLLWRLPVRGSRKGRRLHPSSAPVVVRLQTIPHVSPYRQDTTTRIASLPTRRGRGKALDQARATGRGCPGGDAAGRRC